MHVIRLKQAYKQGIWKEKGQERCYRKQRIRRQDPEADEPGILHADEVSNFVTETENIEVYLCYRLAAEDNWCRSRGVC